MFKKRSFFSRLTGGLSFKDSKYEDTDEDLFEEDSYETEEEEDSILNWQKEEISSVDDSAELSVDMHEDEGNVIIQTMISGVRPEDLHIDISRDSILIEGTRNEASRFDTKNYVIQELYWGKFSRLLALPAEVEPDDATATEKNGLLTIVIPKIDKNKQKKIKVKSI